MGIEENRTNIIKRLKKNLPDFPKGKSSLLLCTSILAGIGFSLVADLALTCPYFLGVSLWMWPSSIHTILKPWAIIFIALSGYYKRRPLNPPEENYFVMMASCMWIAKYSQWCLKEDLEEDVIFLVFRVLRICYITTFGCLEKYKCQRSKICIWKFTTDYGSLSFVIEYFQCLD